eukprot:jgi/Chlat1/2028/Chrsp159S02324
MKPAVKKRPASLYVALGIGAFLGMLVALRNVSSSASHAAAAAASPDPLDTLESIARRLKAELAEKEAELSAKESQLKDAAKKLSSTSSSLSAKDSAISGKDSELKSVSGELQTLQTKARDLEEQLRQKDAALIEARKAQLSQSTQQQQQAVAAVSATGDRADRWMPDKTADSDLARKLRDIAPTGEVLVAISDHRIAWDWPGKNSDKACAPNCNPGMLQTFLKGVKHAGVTNYLIVVPQLHPEDKAMLAFLDSQGVPNFAVDVKMPDSQKDTGSNHAVSALKFTILLKFMRLGYAVLLSDVDIVTLQNPFNFLYRDADIEGLSDGFDERTAYGFVDGIDDPSMGWARYAQSTRQFAFNSGLFYIRPNNRTVNLLERIADRVSKEKAWDQSVYNEEIFFLTHGNYKSPQVTVRVMDIYQFVNSKVLFKTLRYREHPTPVMVHMNYHPDKHERMKGAWKRYVEGDSHALDKFPGGSEPGT